MSDSIDSTGKFLRKFQKAVEFCCVPLALGHQVVHAEVQHIVQSPRFLAMQMLKSVFAHTPEATNSTLFKLYVFFVLFDKCCQ